MECPGCGAQRAFLLLSKGEVAESFMMFPALIPLLILFIFTALHLKFNFKGGAKTIVILFSSSVGLMIINFIIKQVSLW